MISDQSAKRPIANTLTVLLRNDAPLYTVQGPPKYRTVHIKLTEEQINALLLREVLSNPRTYEEVSQSYLEYRGENDD